MLKEISEHENKYHDQRRKDGKISKNLFSIMVFNMMKLLIKFLIIDLLAQFDVAKKNIAKFLRDFLSVL